MSAAAPQTTSFAAPVLTLPRPVPTQRFRQPKKNIPQTPIQRHHILQFIRAYVAEHKPVPPLPPDELKVHADELVAQLECDPIYRDYIGVLLNNEMWREPLAAVPFERRLLLLPKCLRVESKCPAPFDEFGLLCKQCGLCSIQDLQAEAERLGYAVLVAEGTAIVMSLIQTGKDRGHRRRELPQRAGARVSLHGSGGHSRRGRSRCSRTTASTPPSISIGSGITSTSPATTRRAGSISARCATKSISGSRR